MKTVFMKKFKDTIFRHWEFSLTLFITYVLGFLFVGISYSRAKNFSESITETMIFELILETIVPTTVVYVLVCVIVNIHNMSVANAGAGAYFYNLLTILLLFIYTSVYNLYMMNVYSVWWMICESVMTIALLILNFFSYRERYFVIDRRHSLTR